MNDSLACRIRRGPLGLLYPPNEADMNNVMLFRIASPVLLLAATLGTSWGQDILSGEWSPLHHEDYNERIPGPDLGDFAGLPINDSARLFAESWNASRLTLQAHQCRVHVSPYIYHGP